MTTIDNADRASWAESALRAFVANTGQKLEDPYDLDEAIRDLITNLCHLANQSDLDVDLIIERAVGMYHEEKDEDAPEAPHKLAARTASQLATKYQGRIDPADLDDYVYDGFSAAAAAVNSSGLDAQIEYLISANGEEWTRLLLERLASD